MSARNFGGVRWDRLLVLLENALNVTAQVAAPVRRMQLPVVQASQYIALVCAAA